MTYYTVDYEGMDLNDARKKALEDIKFYLGEELFEKAEQQLRSAPGPVSLGDFAFAVSFIGIGGFPVRAWYEHLFGEALA